ncbi:UDPglucose--hexose-1-phosphate uridylyltransferase [Alkalihalobacillus xiaoxiensis]|uniref:Galactose-1-phosphate uridylyltransferase n=1 Tax=Shouchella xiaoxiensis TaxID=766895 RepID=A0ABS2SWV1_9BACI|nr:UDP-glucose--hexose-1-phosphate uridylyltransferase [Shouchella xiaoxiensis]MBM7839969.1 UDPglucose--hexose-1-phosphate uridylyltransferase [Shouchella xiaoxiensis]
MTHSIHHQVEALLAYGQNKQLFAKEDTEYVRNRVLDMLGLQAPSFEQVPPDDMNALPDILGPILSWAVDHSLIKSDTVTYRDLFDTKLMDLLLPRPSSVINTFYTNLSKYGAEQATALFYAFNQDSNYIRTNRIKLNQSWSVQTTYGDLEITINLSKPEKDPVAIAAAKNDSQSITYPGGPLVKENVGFAGSVQHPARQNLRIIPIRLADEQWYLQFSPYVYYNQHAIAFSGIQKPMAITEKTFQRLADFVDQFPHYFIGSNSDLPIVGGSILNHDHYQGGDHSFPMARAPLKVEFPIPDADLKIGIVKWPMSVIRLTSTNRERIISFATTVLTTWRGYSDAHSDVFSHTEGEPHNTITPVLRKSGVHYEMDLVLRNNRRTEEHPLGLFHPHKEVHPIKKENIGLIEVMGLAILPGRLKEELQELASILPSTNAEEELTNSTLVAKHKEWALNFKQRLGKELLTATIEQQLQLEVGRLFEKVLDHAGVFKDSETGTARFTKFISECINSYNNSR